MGPRELSLPKVKSRRRVDARLRDASFINHPNSLIQPDTARQEVNYNLSRDPAIHLARFGPGHPAILDLGQSATDIPDPPEPISGQAGQLRQPPR